MNFKQYLNEAFNELLPNYKNGNYKTTSDSDADILYLIKFGESDKDELQVRTSVVATDSYDFEDSDLDQNYRYEMLFVAFDINGQNKIQGNRKDKPKEVQQIFATVLDIIDKEHKKNGTQTTTLMIDGNEKSRYRMYNTLAKRKMTKGGKIENHKNGKDSFLVIIHPDDLI